MCAYFWIGFIDFMLKGKNTLNYINSLSPNDYAKYNKTILKYFHNQKHEKIIWHYALSIENLKNQKYHISQEKKTLFLFTICSKCKNQDEKLFKEEESIEILKVLGLIESI